MSARVHERSSHEDLCFAKSTPRAIFLGVAVDSIWGEGTMGRGVTIEPKLHIFHKSNHQSDNLDDMSLDGRGVGCLLKSHAAVVLQHQRQERPLDKHVPARSWDLPSDSGTLREQGSHTGLKNGQNLCLGSIIHQFRNA